MRAVLLIFFGTCIASLIVTHFAVRIALLVGLTDRPDGHRKLHAKVTPLGGGVAVFLTSVGVLALLYFVDNPWQHALLLKRADILALAAASLVIVIVGVTDDYLRLRGRQKLAGQVLAALVLVGCGLSIRSLEVFNWRIELGLLTVPFTIFWLLGAINSVNLMDGIDGLAATIGIVLSLALAIMAAMTSRPEAAIVAIVFAGSLAGFLKFNFPPAKLFLGDAGSMLIGLVVGVLAIHASLKGPGTVLLAAPLAVGTIPLLDSTAAILRRKLTGRSIYTSDRGHLHHRLVDVLGSNRMSLGFLAVCCLFTCTAALVSVLLKNDLIALMSGVVVVVILIMSRAFGHAEMLLVASRLRSMGLSLGTPKNRPANHAWQEVVQLQGTREWNLLWATLTEWAGKMSLQEMRLDLNLAVAQEGFHASWKRPGNGEPERRWQFELPLIVADNPVGYLRVIGQRSGNSASMDMESLIQLLESFEDHLLALAGRSEDIPSGKPEKPVAERPVLQVSGQSAPSTHSLEQK